MKQLPRYTVQIDEEGYPLFDGLRVQDEELLATLLSGLRRTNTEFTNAPLITTCEGEVCFIEAFDAPLVAQSVENVSDSSAVWVFPGALKHSVPHSTLSVDPWNRLHTMIGQWKIPAVLSRKAQAQLLHRAPVEKLKPPPFRGAPKDVETASFWDQAFEEKRDGWELGQPTPVLTNHFPEIAPLLPPKSQLLVPGAGRGHDARFLEQQGSQVTVVDFAANAEKDFRKLYPKSAIHFKRQDVFQFLDEHSAAFHGIFEHTLFCAITPQKRQEYIEKIHTSLKPKGFWFGVFFVHTGPEGPPFGLTQWELRQMTQATFRIRAWTVSKASIAPRLGNELWAILEKR